jgi:hypothetical protein
MRSRLSVLGLLTMAVWVAGCAKSGHMIDPPIPVVTTAGFFAKLHNQILQEGKLDPQKPIEIKDLDLTFTNDGTLNAGSIEVRSTDLTGHPAQIRVDIVEQRWNVRSVPLYGYPQEFVPGQPLLTGLDQLSWQDLFQQLGSPKEVALHLNAPSQCEIVVNALNPNPQRTTLLETTGQQRLTVCQAGDR